MSIETDSQQPEVSTKAPILSLGITKWEADTSDHDNIVSSLERGEVLYFPELPFVLQSDEAELLDPALVSPKRKNIMYQTDKDTIRGVAEEVSAENKRCSKDC